MNLSCVRLCVCECVPWFVHSYFQKGRVSRVAKRGREHNGTLLLLLIGGFLFLLFDAQIHSTRGRREKKREEGGKERCESLPHHRSSFRSSSIDRRSDLLSLPPRTPFCLIATIADEVILLLQAYRTSLPVIQ